MSSKPRVHVGLNAVIVAVTERVPRILTVTVREPALALDASAPPVAGGAGQGLDAVPYGPLDPEGDRTLELTLRTWVAQQTGMALGYVEQLYTFGDRFRDPREHEEGRRTISVAYLALVREGEVGGDVESQWRDCYDFLPWEDWRTGRPEVVSDRIEPALGRWVEQAEALSVRRERSERVEIAFRVTGTAQDADRVLERYELLYEAGLVEEALRDAVRAGGAGEAERGSRMGRPMALDHRRIVATALGRLRGKLKYRPVVFELLPEEFTLTQVQQTVEALYGMPMHSGNFRRQLAREGLVERTGRMDTGTGGRPAMLYRFRREVLLERSEPGV